MKFHPPLHRSVQKDPLPQSFFRPQRDVAHDSGATLSRGSAGQNPRSAAATPSSLLGGMVQCKVMPGRRPTGDIHASAREGIGSGGSSFPHLSAIQESFGPEHDLSGVKAHLGGGAARANDQMGSEAYATGNHVAFRSMPSRWLAAHEAAHVVQQRQGIRLGGGVGRTGDWGERNADAVADRVAAGRSARDLLAPQGAQGLVGSSQQGAQAQAGGPQLSQGSSPVQQKVEGMDKDSIQQQPWWAKFAKTTNPNAINTLLAMAGDDSEYSMAEALQSMKLKLVAVNGAVKAQWQQSNYDLEENNDKKLKINSNNNNDVKEKKDSLDDLVDVVDQILKEDDSGNNKKQAKEDVKLNNNNAQQKPNKVENKTVIQEKQGVDKLGYKFYKTGKFDPRSNMSGQMAKGSEFGKANLKQQQAMLGGGDQMRVKPNGKNKADDIGVLKQLADFDQHEVKLIKSEDERSNYQISVNDDGKFVWFKSQELVTAQSGIFVMMNDKIYLHDEEQNLKIKHTSLSGGQGVFMAGTMKLNDGVLEEVSSASGHYKPSVQQLQRYVKKLAELGVPLDQVAVWVVTGKFE